MDNFKKTMLADFCRSLSKADALLYNDVILILLKIDLWSHYRSFPIFIWKSDSLIIIMSSLLCDNDCVHLGLMRLFLLLPGTLVSIHLLLVSLYYILKSQPKPSLVTLYFLELGIQDPSRQALMIHLSQMSKPL